MLLPVVVAAAPLLLLLLLLGLLLVTLLHGALGHLIYLLTALVHHVVRALGTPTVFGQAPA
jgi:hypothetical protein